MATELQIRAKLDTMRSLPPHIEKLARSIGTVKWPEQPTRLDLPMGMELTAEDRVLVQSRLAELTEIITGSNLTQNESAKARLSLLTKMQLGFPTAGGSSVEAATARSEVYEDAVEDMPPWAIANAVKRWARGDVPDDLRMGTLNFNFAPSPAVLRKLCLVELGPYEVQVTKLKRLLMVISTERAMDPAPLPPPESQIETSHGAIVVKMKRVQ
ncbi:hypothetical protein [Tardiphaga sp. 709]|uniref:hypothetical protein n=1 Tax=Tardiphaga sp. 709 TaxID=3076039 RepID=UPI0028EB1BB7|nr:hypothetical protein [Tardiphaga sp. 709]WNV09973.1 hypothetical protein RSO67_01890 [Tardiphaga sp. 709]